MSDMADKVKKIIKQFECDNKDTVLNPRQTLYRDKGLYRLKSASDTMPCYYYKREKN